MNSLVKSSELWTRNILLNNKTFYFFQATSVLEVIQLRYSNFKVIQIETYFVGLINFFHSNAMICEYIKCVYIHSSLESVGIRTPDFFFKVLDANHWATELLQVIEVYLLTISYIYILEIHCYFFLPTDICIIAICHHSYPVTLDSIP